jgi:adenosylmethionine-8-amino-7-oxononanoate aminotransferase
MSDGVAYCHTLFFATSAAEELASLLINSANGEMARAFFVSSGSESIEAALKMARQYHLEKFSPEPQRIHFIGRQQSYHGTTLGALAAGGHRARRAIYEPMLSKNHTFVSPCFAYREKRSTETDGAYIRRLEEELDAEFQKVGPDRVAAFIAEPVVGAALRSISIRLLQSRAPCLR